VEVAEERVREKSAKKPVKEAPSAFYSYMDSATKRSRNAMTSHENYSRKASRATSRLPSIKPASVLTPAPLSMKRFDIWLDADKQAAMFHSWLLDEDWTWLARALGLVVDVGNIKTISAQDRDPNRANIEIHAIRTAMKRGALGFPEPHMVVVVTQWRAGFLNKDKQRKMDETLVRTTILRAISSIALATGC
jgi:hypothetical protein